MVGGGQGGGGGGTAVDVSHRPSLADLLQFLSLSAPREMI